LWKTVVNATKVLESVLMLAPTTIEMGLTPLALLHLGPLASVRQKIAGLVAARNASPRYSTIQIMSSNELKFFVATFAQSGKAQNEIFKLRKLVNFEPPRTIYLWNSKTGIIQSCPMMTSPKSNGNLRRLLQN
jgi:hypothetical protein